MKGKNILVTVALVLGFGGLIANSVVGVANNKALEDKIESLRGEMEAADEANKAELRAEYTALINQTRDNLKASFEAADVALQQGLTQLKADLEAALDEVRENSDAADVILANQIATKINGLLEAIAGVADDLSDLDSAVSADIAGILSEISDIQDDLDDLFDFATDVAGAFVDVYSVLDAMGTSLDGINNTIVTLAGSLDALENSLESNYYTISQINGLLGNVNSAISTLTNLFKLNGTVTSLADLMEVLNDKFAEIDLTIGTLLTAADAQALIDAINDAIDAINDRLDEFYGDAAKELKGQLVNALSLYYLQFKETIIDVKEDQIKTANGGTLPTAYVGLFDNINTLYKTTLRAVLDEGISRIILAKDVAEAVEMEAEFELRMESVMFKVMYIAEQEMILSNIDSYVTTDCPVNFTTSVADGYKTQVNAVTFDDTQLANATAAEALEYYNGLIESISNVDRVAKGYNSIVTSLKTADAALDADAVLNTTQIEKFKLYNDSAAAYANYASATTGVTTQAEVDEAVAAFEEKFDIVAYGAANYASAVTAVEASKGNVDALSELEVAEASYFKGLCDDAIAFDTEFDPAFSAVLANYTDVDAAKDDIDNILVDYTSALTAVEYAAAQFATVNAAVATAKGVTAALTNVDSTVIDYFDADIEDATAFDDYKAGVASTLAAVDHDSDLDAVKAAIDAVADGMKNDVEVITYAATGYDGLVGAAEAEKTSIAALADLSAAEAGEFEDRVDAAVATSVFTPLYEAELAAYNDVDAAKEALDGYLAAGELKVDIFGYAADNFNTFANNHEGQNTAIDALTNLSTAEKDAFKAIAGVQNDSSAYLTAVDAIAAAASELDAAKAAIDDLLVGNEDAIAAVVYAANEYDTVKATEAADEATFAGYSNLDAADIATLTGTSASALTFGSYASAIADSTNSTNWVDEDTTKADADELIAAIDANLTHNRLLADSYNTLVTYRKDVKASISADNATLVANGTDAIFNDYLDNLFNLASVTTGVATLVSQDDFNQYVEACKAAIDNVKASAAVENALEAAYNTENALLAANYTSDYQVAYFQAVNDSAAAEYSAVAGGAFKAGFAPETDAGLAAITANKAAYDADVLDVNAGAAELKRAMDKGVEVKGAMDGYVGTYQALFEGLCTNTHDSLTDTNVDQKAVWDLYEPQILQLIADNAYLYGSNLDAVPTIGASESYATTKANFDAYIAGLEDDAAIDARYVVYTTAINALFPQMQEAFNVLDLAYAEDVAKDAIGEDLDGASGTLKTLYDSYCTTYAGDPAKLAQFQTSWNLVISNINSAKDVSSANVETVIASVVAYWATL